MKYVTSVSWTKTNAREKIDKCAPREGNSVKNERKKRNLSLWKRN